MSHSKLLKSITRKGEGFDMKNLWHGILVLIIISLMAGCATNPPKDESKENPEQWQKDIDIIQPRR
jgi:hypothetical protein